MGWCPRTEDRVGKVLIILTDECSHIIIMIVESRRELEESWKRAGREPEESWKRAGRELEESWKRAGRELEESLKRTRR